MDPRIRTIRFWLYAAVLVAGVVLSQAWYMLAFAPMLFMPVFGTTGCVTFSDTFTRSNSTNIGSDWTEVTGDWSIASNALSISSTGAVVKCNTNAPGNNNYQIKVTPGGTTGDKIRVLLNYTDSSNYHCVEVEVGSKVRIIEKVMGAETTLVEVYNNASDTLFVCLDSDNRIRAMMGTAAHGDLLAIAEISPTSPTVGLGTGGTVSSSVTFDNFSLETPGVDTCDACKFCSNCPDTVSFEMQVQLSGMGTCGGCSDGDGTYVCTLIGSNAPFLASAGGAGSCVWLHELASPICGGYAYILVVANDSGTYSVWITNDITLSGGSSFVSFTFLSNGCVNTPNPSGISATGGGCAGATATITGL